MTRGRPNGGLRPPTRPFEQAQLNEEANVSEDVARVMTAIKDFDTDKVTATIWLKSGNGTGPWRHCDDIGLPPDMPAIMADMRERFGAGDYELRVSALGRVRANLLFSLAKEKTPALAPAAPAAPAGGVGTDLLGMLLAQQSEARRDAQAAADRQMTMITGLATAILPAILQRPTPPAGISAGEIAALLAAGQGGQGKGGSLKEMVETLAALKGLTDNPAPQLAEGAGAGFDADELLGSAARLIGPGMRALGDMLAARRGEAAGGSASGGQPPGGATLALPAGGSASPGPASRFRVLDLVRLDIQYGFGRGHDPGKVADLVYDVIEANGVTEAEINELAATFALSPSGLADLAAEGIDLTGDPQWAAEFFAALQEIHLDTLDNLAGNEGRQGDATPDGGPRQARQHKAADPPAGGGADNGRLP